VDAAFFDLRVRPGHFPRSTVNNQASIHVLEKIGMRWEAVFRKQLGRAKNRCGTATCFVLPRESVGMSKT